MKWTIDTREQLFTEAFANWLVAHPGNAKQIESEIALLKYGDVRITETIIPLLIENKIGNDLTGSLADGTLETQLKNMSAESERLHNLAHSRSIEIPFMCLFCCDTPDHYIDRATFKRAVGLCQDYNIRFHHSFDLPAMISRMWKLLREQIKPINIAQNLVYKPDKVAETGYALATLVPGISPEMGYYLCEGLASLAEVVAAYPDLDSVKAKLDRYRGQDTNLTACNVLEAINYDAWLHECATLCDGCGKIIQENAYKRSKAQGGWECEECHRRVI